MSGLIGALKTLGRGWVFELAEPSAERMVTVGRLVILSVCGGVVLVVSIDGRLSQESLSRFDVASFEALI